MALAVLCVVAGVVVYPRLKGGREIGMKTEVGLTTASATEVPEAVTPEITREEAAQPDWIVWNVPEGQVEPEVEAGIKRAVYENRFLNPPTKEARQQYIWNFSIEMLEVEDDWAILSAAPKDKESGDLIDTEGLPLLGRKVNDHWEIVYPGEDTFLQWIPLIADSLLAPDAKEFLIMRYRGEE